MAKKKPAPKRGASRYQAPAAKNGVPGWVWLVAGLAIGGFIMFLMKLEPGRKDVQRERPDAQRPAAVQGKQPQQNGQAQQPAQTQTPAQAKPKYEFYTLLPESEVVVPPEAVPERPAAAHPAELARPTKRGPALAGQVPPPLPKAVVAASTQFFLQAGSFRKQSDADRVRAQIILLGQSVNVEAGNVRDETWYRVMVGPFNSRDQLSQAQKTLSSNGFSNLLLQQRKAR
ncbi:Cell division protein FtsN [Pseudomonas aeruginosa]|uniref:SPOR domain-containing protein n=1 Tax=Pseudomonas aeruginosa TaxID=287 RepID=UPI000F2DB338|nr:SPOR domain-containing protein [Pseudomonas aeruginosa]VCX89611.1 Cell division protein FtsN [Pseudomonas aeruginosa]